MDGVKGSKFATIKTSQNSKDTNSGATVATKESALKKMKPIDLDEETSDYQKIRQQSVQEKEAMLIPVMADLYRYKREAGIGPAPVCKPTKGRSKRPINNMEEKNDRGDDSDDDYLPPALKKAKEAKELEPQKCPCCPAMVKIMENHMKNCHTGEMLVCSACPYSSRMKNAIDSHFKRVHTDLPMETCATCGDMFKDLRSHVSRSECGTGTKVEATIPCPKGCGKMFKMKSLVDKHVKQVHLKIKDKHCPNCDYKTYSTFNLKLHVTKQHEGKKMVKQQCLYSDKTPYAISMDHHMKIFHYDKM